MATGADVIKKFIIASMFMWILPVAILYGFHHNWFSGSIQTPQSQTQTTLLSGFLAVISVNIIIAFYICMAMREPFNEHCPDPSFLAAAKASLNQPNPAKEEQDGPSQVRDKQE
ncbi:hypothetical protein Nepgr_009206 [Nepenthes gracilis]|uniref:Vacuolar ATPase assembly integral membrane protein VMA21 homolog n=1 Tax=Nepenthes gracilis TaxID=150966 RepID=A0AAD3XK64_NEPGR|nr:hypothetical protein Nepgr_009206 [Nepenthes gracilis]